MERMHSVFVMNILFVNQNFKNSILQPASSW